MFTKSIGKHYINKVRRNTVAYLFLSGVSINELCNKLGFNYKFVRDTLSDSVFMRSMARVMEAEVFRFSMLSRIYGDDMHLSPIPSLYLFFTKFSDYGGFPLLQFPVVTKVGYVIQPCVGEGLGDEIRVSIEKFRRKRRLSYERIRRYRLKKRSRKRKRMKRISACGK